MRCILIQVEHRAVEALGHLLLLKNTFDLLLDFQKFRRPRLSAQRNPVVVVRNVVVVHPEHFAWVLLGLDRDLVGLPIQLPQCFQVSSSNVVGEDTALKNQNSSIACPAVVVDPRVDDFRLDDPLASLYIWRSAIDYMLGRAFGHRGAFA